MNSVDAWSRRDALTALAVLVIVLPAHA